MNNNPIEIFKQRDFGEFISTPITFFIQEIKLLSKVLLIFVGPFIVLNVILVSVFHIGYDQDIFSMFTEQNYNQNSGGNLIIRLVDLFQSIMLYTSLGVYVKLYIERGKGNFDVQDIWQVLSKFYWPVLGGQFLAGIMIIVGILVLVVPGIYLGGVFSILFVVIIFEEEGVSKSISRCFEVIKGNWWTAFGTFIVMGIMFLVVSGILGLLLGLVFSVAGFSQIVSVFSGVIIGLVTIMLTAVLVLLPIFLYASFVADKENPKLMNRINDISETDDVNIFEVSGNKSDEQNMKEESTSTEENELLKKEEKPKTQDDWEKLLDEQEKKNRFEDGEDDIDRFKPKF